MYGIMSIFGYEAKSLGARSDPLDMTNLRWDSTDTFSGLLLRTPHLITVGLTPIMVVLRNINSTLDPLAIGIALIHRFVVHIFTFGMLACLRRRNN